MKPVAMSLFLLILWCPLLLLADTKCDRFDLNDFALGKIQSSHDFFSSDHSITIQQKPFDYTITSGYLPIYSKDHKVEACVFFTAYSVHNGTNRPLSFLYNGGPGGASGWVHLGAFGPKTIDLGDEGLNFHSGAELRENPATLLVSSYLVFIDPVNTGFSRPATGFTPSQFRGLKNDYTSIGDFIYQYVTRFQRWQSPKYLVGESYGTTRSAVLSRYLQNHLGLRLSGIVLISPYLTQGLDTGDPANDFAYEIALPTYALVAQYHHKIVPTLQAKSTSYLMKNVKGFAASEYHQFLLKGDSANETERMAMAEKLSALTGLDTSVIVQSNDRIGMDLFTRNLLGRGSAISYLDGRVVGPLSPADASVGESDPMLGFSAFPFTPGLNAYFQNEVGIHTSLIYKEDFEEAGNDWPLEDGRNSFGVHLNVIGDLKQTMLFNPSLKIFVASGIYDLVTTTGAAEYTMARIGLPPGSKRFQIETYPAGHPMYTQRYSQNKLGADLFRFYTETSPPPNPPNLGAPR